MSGAPLTFAFEYDDERVREAARQAWLRDARRLLDWRTLALLAVGIALFAWSALTPTSPAWWLVLTGIVPAGVLLVAAAWLIGFWWVPRHVLRRMARLPHRLVEVTLSEATFAVRTANESYEVKWSEVKEVVELPSFFIVHLRSGGALPLLRSAVGPDGVKRLRRK